MSPVNLSGRLVGYLSPDPLLLDLVRWALGGEPDALGLCGVTAEMWKRVVDAAFDHGIEAIAADGYRAWREAWPEAECVLEAETDEMEDLRGDWFGSSLQVEDAYQPYVRAMISLVKVYAEAGIDTMILKGFGLSLNYPVPAHRPVGDIDTYHFGEWREADSVVSALGKKVDYSHHHHSVFRWKGYSVENHYDIVNRHASRSGRRVDDLLKALAQEHPREVEVGGVKVFLPSATFNGVFLLVHAASHFAGDHITLRHLLDWALFVDKDWEKIDWQRVTAEAGRLGLLRFLSCLNALSVDCLGIAHEKFPQLKRELNIEQRVMEDILHPTFSETGSGFLFKLRRLKANLWKRNLVSATPFLFGMVRLAWSHAVNPEKLIMD